MYYKVNDWETIGGSKKYNFSLQVYDESMNPIEHLANDRCYWPTAWRKLNAQMQKAIKKAEKAKLQRIY
jgi:hypothetical protein